MKQRIFNRGRGWYISASNYRNADDKAYMNVGFLKGQEPKYDPPVGNDFVFIDIDIEEQKYTSYNKQIQLFVFKYTIIQPEGELTEVEKDNQEFAESIKGTAYEKKFGGNVDVDISPDDLPFY